jgi:hypothetical protein
MNSLYTTLKSTCLFSSAIAGVYGGFKIYQKWNRGELVLPLIIAWIFGLCLVNMVIFLVDSFIASGSYRNITPSAGAKEIAIESYQVALVVGVIISIFSVVKIYQKYNDGEDVYDLMYKWLGALFFLFFFGYVIESLLSS